ncbi:hypothetical protein HC928_02035 [bacterium]|nr:hypothetical protein [bacterium]
MAFARCRELKLEPPTPDRLERIIRTALATYQDRFHTRILARLAPATCIRLDALLTTEMPPDPDADDTLPAASQRTTLQLLKADAGPVQMATAYAEVAKLEHLRALALPLDLFTGIPLPLLRTYAQQVQAEEPHELRRHPEPLRDPAGRLLPPAAAAGNGYPGRFVDPDDPSCRVLGRTMSRTCLAPGHQTHCQQDGYLACPGGNGGGASR